MGHAAMSDTLRIDVWRGTESGQFQTFAVPSREHQTVLDVATEMSASTIPLPVGN
jgi:fumarate reductase iron-sulfur subunit